LSVNTVPPGYAPESTISNLRKDEAPAKSGVFFMAKTNAARGRAFEKKQEQMRTRQGAKKHGELAEMAFTLKAESLGFDVAKPYGENNRYDFIVRSGQYMQKEFGTGKSFRTLRTRWTFWLSTSCLRTHGSSSRSEPSRPPGASASIRKEPPTGPLRKVSRSLLVDGVKRRSRKGQEGEKHLGKWLAGV
jgi:hypothetical protein